MTYQIFNSTRTNIIPKNSFTLGKLRFCKICKKEVEPEGFGYVCQAYKTLFCSLYCCLVSFDFKLCGSDNHIHPSVVFKELEEK